MASGWKEKKATWVPQPSWWNAPSVLKTPHCFLPFKVFTTPQWFQDGGQTSSMLAFGEHWKHKAYHLLLNLAPTLPQHDLRVTDYIHSLLSPSKYILILQVRTWTCVQKTIQPSTDITSDSIYWNSVLSAEL